MSHIGPYRIPFPYDPYPLQEHAMTALRDYLEQNQQDEDAEGMSTQSWVRDPVTAPAIAMPPSLASTMAATSRSGTKGPRPRVAVLESPTGTGKSQMLLNSVLSYLFETVEHAQDTVRVSSASGSVAAEPPAAVATDAACGSQTENISHLPLPSLTLEETIAQRQVEEEIEQLRRERRARVRAQRRQIQRARKLMHLSQQQTASSGGDNHFILTQDPLAWYAEQSPAIEGNCRSDGIGDRGRALPLSLASLSSSSSSSSSASTSDESEDSDAEGQLEAALTTLVPLRKPKIFFSSRTHTQLQQLMEDLKRTAFAQKQLRPRLLSMEVAEPAASRTAARGPRVKGGKHGTTASEPPRQREQQQQLPRRLTAVHVASRRHLCLNKSLRRKAGDSNDRLNYYCREAIRFERSKQGRQHRRQQQQQQLQDLEDDKGCTYCVESHLRSLMTFLREEQRSADATTDAADGCAGASSNGTPPSSVYTMDRLRKLGAALQACPYIATRLLLRGADIVFIPYGYVLDESQRSVLLCGPATNPATASEAEAVFSDCSAADKVDGSCMPTDGGGGLSPGDVAPHALSSLGSVLYHRRQRVTATEAFKSRRRHPQQQRSSSSSTAMAAHAHGGTAHGKGESEADAAWQAIARFAPPSLRGDIVVFDEAHNIADHCRSISTVSVTPRHLRLARQLFEVYLERYASRLLTRNKQRLRELIRFHSSLLHFCEHATDTALVEDGGGAEGRVASPISALSPQLPPAPPHTRVFSFNSFLFDADIDCVDVYAFLTFLADSQLPRKLQGFVSYLLEAEQQREEGKKATTAAVSVARATSGTDYSPHATAGVKRQRSNCVGRGVSSASAEAQRQRRFLSSISSPDHTESIAEGKRSPPHLSLPELLSRPHQTAGAAMTATAADASAVPSSYDLVQLRAFAAEALQRVERFLGALYISDTASTRVLWTPPQPAPSSSPPSRDAASATQEGEGTLKIIQLEPGMHTFAPLVMEARAVVLAGGTMQPLAFTCGPLLPPSPAITGDDSHAHPNGRSLAAPTSSHFHLISEGHVVPPSSVQVWALGTGPSGLRMELSQQALGLRGGAADTIHETSPLRRGLSSVISPHADRVLSEVGSTLLNLARVFPPAGVICFFTSHDVMDTTVSVLERAGYYAQINEVKRIFKETRNGSGEAGKGTAGGADGGTGDAMARLLREYQDWIYGKDGNDSSLNPTVAPSTAAASSLLSPNAATPQHVTQPSRRGAFLFAVMGGRLSEGINFSDDLGRAVVVLGMPYANPTDVELQMSLRHVVQTRLRTNLSAGLQDTCSLAGSSASVASSPFTCPEEWGLYMDSMMRTVNQCIGRCIRHAGDYATIILLDARYAERQDARRRVSAWLQPSMRVAKTFGQCFSGVREFFAGRQRNV